MTNEELYSRPDFVERLDVWGAGSVWDEALDILRPLVVDEKCPVLDIACGTGRVLEKLLALGADAYGIDYTQGLLDLAGKRVRPERLALGDAHDLPFATGAFEYAYTVGSIEHFQRLPDAIKECVRVATIGSVHHIPVATDRDEGWVTDGTQYYYHYMLDTWVALFADVLGPAEIRTEPSAWRGERTKGKWFIVSHHFRGSR